MHWVWFDRVISVEKGRSLVTIKNVTWTESYFQDPNPVPGPSLLPGSLIIEGMTQTAGTLVGHANDFRNRVVLAMVKRAELTRDVTPGDTLCFTATIRQIGAAGASTIGTVELLDLALAAPPVTIGHIDLVFAHLADDPPGADLPAHNFVFAAYFRQLVAGSLVEQHS